MKSWWLLKILGGGKKVFLLKNDGDDRKSPFWNHQCKKKGIITAVRNTDTFSFSKWISRCPNTISLSLYPTGLQCHFYHKLSFHPGLLFSSMISVDAALVHYFMSKAVLCFNVLQGWILPPSPLLFLLLCFLTLPVGLFFHMSFGIFMSSFRRSPLDVFFF